MKDIKVSYDTWKNLSELKLKEKLKSMDFLINKLLKQYNETKTI